MPNVAFHFVRMPSPMLETIYNALVLYVEEHPDDDEAYEIYRAVRNVRAGREKQITARRATAEANGRKPK